MELQLFAERQAVGHNLIVLHTAETRYWVRHEVSALVVIGKDLRPIGPERFAAQEHEKNLDPRLTRRRGTPLLGPS
jgi:hypothetical protein